MNTHEQRLSIGEALGFLASVIKSGESWSSECQTILDAAKAQVLSLEKQLSEALAAASRAREEQGALRAALESMLQVHCWEGDAGTCFSASHIAARAALAPPAAESQENQQQLTGKGAK